MSALANLLRHWTCARQAKSCLAAVCLITAVLAAITPCFGQGDGRAAALGAPNNSEVQQEADAATANPPAGDLPDQPSHGSVYILTASAGFPETGGNIVRPDYFAPVRVTVVNRSGEIFSGTVQLLGRDRDGETVIYERPGIGVKPSDKADVLMSWFARDSGLGGASELAVRLLDDEGKLVHSMDVPVELAGENEHLILDISPQSIKALVQRVFEDKVELRHRGRVRTGYLRPQEVPTTWYDLEAVDVIVCDQPDEAGLQPDQVKALMQWVRQGGMLVLGPGSLQSLGDTELVRELPATPVTMVRLSAEDFRPGARPAAGGAEEEPAGSRGRSGEVIALGLNRSYLNLGWLKETGVWQLKAKADTTTILELPLKRGNWLAVGRRHVGLGVIVQSAMSLKDLLNAKTVEGLQPGMGTRVKPEIFGVRTLDVAEEQFSRTGMNWSQDWPNRFGPRELIKGEAEFRAAGTALATVLMLLTIVYGFTVTVGTWLVLRRRNLTQHSWLAFGVVAVIGSVGAGLLVQSARGIRAEVKQQSIVDLDATSGLAHVHTFYGLRMPYDARVDVDLATQRDEQLPPEQAKDAYIRPAGNLEAGLQERFAVRRDYTVRYGETMLNEVPIRATAKQFESYWHGPVGGTIQGTIVLEADGRQISSRSWISNQTDLNLRHCYLVFATTPSFNQGQRDANIVVLELDRLPAGKVRNDLRQVLEGGMSVPGYTQADYRLTKQADRWLAELSWNPMGGGRFNPGQPGSPDRVDRSDVTQARAALMMTVLSDLPSKQQQGLWGGGNQSLQPFVHLPRSGGRWLDLRHVLDGKAAVLIGLADGAGPTRLKVNGSRLEPSTARCVVRAVLPLVGAAGARDGG